MTTKITTYPRVASKISKSNILNTQPPKKVTIKSNFFKKSPYIFTKDAAFAIEPQPPYDYDFQTHSDFLYIRNDVQIDQSSALANLINNNFIIKTGITKDLTVNLSGIDITRNYIEYKFYRPLIDERVYVGDAPIDDDKSINENDCLKFGECITVANQTYNKSKLDTMLKAQTGPPVLQSSLTNKPFGATEYDKDNIAILKTIPVDKKNNYAVPTNGESYAIVRTKIVAGAPYHIAFVLYTHNNVNITLEAEADNKNNYTPKFGFYDITPNGKTFHRRWSAELYKDSSDPDKQHRYDVLYNNGETIVLKTRKLNDIIKEMAAEVPKPKGRAKKSIKGGRNKKIKIKNKSRRRKK
jgi:hypothetical protein